MENIELHIHIKGVKRPIILELENDKQVDAFYRELETHDIVRFGQLIFRRDEFLYATMEV